jgi:hypothetical protein
MNQTRRALREKWRQIVLSQRSSGETVAAYCRARGIGQASFFAWRRRLGSCGSAEFVEVKAAADEMPAVADVADEQAFAIEVCVRGGRRMRVRAGVDRESLIETIRVLEGLA